MTAQSGWEACNDSKPVSQLVRYGSMQWHQPASACTGSQAGAVCLAATHLCLPSGFKHSASSSMPAEGQSIACEPASNQPLRQAPAALPSVVAISQHTPATIQAAQLAAQQRYREQLTRRVRVQRILHQVCPHCAAACRDKPIAAVHKVQAAVQRCVAPASGAREGQQEGCWMIKVCRQPSGASAVLVPTRWQCANRAIKPSQCRVNRT